MQKFEKATEFIEVRCTPSQKSKIQTLAKMYAEGNMSVWVLYGALEVERKYLRKEKPAASANKTKGG